MRLVKEIYWSYIQKLGATNIGDILIPIDGVFIKLEDVPNSYIQEMFECNKEDLYDMIISEVSSSSLEDSVNDL